MDSVLPSLKYYVLSPREEATRPFDGVLAQTYIAWREVWSKVHQEIGHHGDLSADELLRHDRCCVLKVGDEIAGIHLYSFFDLSRPIELHRRYINDNFPPEVMERIQRVAGARVMSMEYLSVTENFRGSRFPYSVANLLIALGENIFLSESALDGVIACTRNSRKVNEMALSLGFTTLARDRIAFGETSDLVLFNQKSRPSHPDPKHEAVIQTLWRKRAEGRDVYIQPGEQHAA